MKNRHDKRPAFFTVEMIAAIGIVLAVSTAFAIVMTGAARSSDLIATRQRAWLAAEAILNERRAGFAPSADDVWKRFRATAEMSESAGKGDWSGLTRVDLVVRAMTRRGEKIRVELSTYMEGSR